MVLKEIRRRQPMRHDVAATIRRGSIDLGAKPSSNALSASRLTAGSFFAILDADAVPGGAIGAVMKHLPGG